MISYTTSEELSKNLRKSIEKGKKVAFVPTMGALHEGHLELIRTAKQQCDIVVCSIFVNPTQFNNQRDLEKYPRNLKIDKTLLESEHCDYLYAPSVQEMYPNGLSNGFVVPDIGNITKVLEGTHRPGHFEGMMQVVSLLLDNIPCTYLYMGLKDYQQYCIVKKMIKAQKRSIQLFGVPIVREKSGLAMSSRNRRLTPKARFKAANIYLSLLYTQIQFDQFELDLLEKNATEFIENVSGMKVEYFTLVDCETLEPSKNKENIIALTAVWYEDVRLIDNMFMY